VFLGPGQFPEVKGETVWRLLLSNQADIFIWESYETLASLLLWLQS